MGWIGAIVLLGVIVPVVVYLLNGVLRAARDTRAAVDKVERAAAAASEDLDAVPLLLTTQNQVHAVVGVVADYGGSLDTILEDA